MNDVLLTRLIRQLKWLNFWVTFFGVLFLVSFIIAGILLFKAVVFIQRSEQKISDLQAKTSQTLDVQKQVCSNSQLSNILSKTSTYCK
jgi:uncharacterized membrane protein YciS (DUF1049 family)